jgi:receptor protein-tyrosine kinase
VSVSRSNVIPAPGVSVALPRGDRSIGAILVDEGRLKAESAEAILRLQREQGLRFGDAAIQLGLITKEDIDFAISRQFDYPYLRRGQSAVSESLVAAYDPFTSQVEALRALRSQLMLRWFEADISRKALAIVSAEHDEGRSFIAANLAVVFSQLGEHTLLIDADMRNPCQHQLFGLDNRAGLSAILTGRGGPETIQRIPDLRDLSVLPAGAQPPNPLELLARPEFCQLVRHEWANEYDVLIIDAPPDAEIADAQTIASCAGGAMIVVRRNASRISRVRGLAESLAQTGVTIVGTVLNDF